MSAGTLTLTNNSAAVMGSGTAFTTELTAGDFIVVTVGGIPYTLPVKTVNSNTSLTLVSNFTGPTQSGAAWYAVPRIAMNLVTAAVVTQAAEALRGLNYDKQNWQNIFSGTGNVTVKLPDGSTWTGPAWHGIALTLNGKASAGDNNDITSLSGLTTPFGTAQGGTGAKTVAGARTNLNLERFAQQTSETNIRSPQDEAKIFVTNTDWGGFSMKNGGYIPLAVNRGGTGATTAAEALPNLGMTVDTNGFVKKASPIVKLKGDGTAEFNAESEGVTVERISTGEYKVSGVLGFNSDPVWGGISGGYVLPQNGNGLPLLWLDYDVAEDGDLIIRTYHREHVNIPEYAQNHIEGLKDGDPVDIPAGRWVDLRVEMPADSIWNRRQEEERVAMENAERERLQNQQDAQ
ncbi:phage tail fiber protein [Citrobacter braakii]|uniref:phage tail fiber protein n=1 Tax=Citrobacter braakii TaxID=57706 RepID=UPI001C7DC67C|nr:phage tail protein [Citrobacter braakii]MCY9801302.1 phage tail protein [Citrobacter braakii]